MCFGGCLTSINGGVPDSSQIIQMCVIVWEVKLAVFVSDKVPELVRGDPGRFRQIITNLVGNSVKVSVLLNHLVACVSFSHNLLLILLSTW